VKPIFLANLIRIVQDVHVVLLETQRKFLSLGESMRVKMDVEVRLDATELDKRDVCEDCHNFLNAVWRLLHDTVKDREERGINVNVIIILARENLAKAKFVCRKDHTTITANIDYNINPTTKVFTIWVIGHVKKRPFIFR
jgi:hypothetical protein